MRTRPTLPCVANLPFYDQIVTREAQIDVTIS